MLRLAPAASRSSAPATVTTPVLASMANRPPALSVSDVGDRVGRGVRVAGRGGDAHAVPLAAFSSTALAAALVSADAPTSNSSTSLIVDR